MMECTRCQTPLEAGDLRCAVCALVLAPDAPTTDLALRANILRCTDCGAAITFVAEIQAPRCGFCNAVMRIEQPEDPVERAELFLPFSLARPSAQAALRKWLGRRGWMHPRDLASGAAVEKLEPLHWAAWLVDARATVSWTADSDSDSGSSAWAPHSGKEEMAFDSLVIPATRGLTLDECERLTPYYVVAAATPIGDAAGVVEEFDAQRSAARRTVIASLESNAADRLQQGTIPGTKFRNVKVGVLLQSLRTRRIVLPAWVLAYRYRGTPYRAVVHGQDATCVTGEAPYSTWKILGVIGAVILALAALVMMLSA